MIDLEEEQFNNIMYYFSRSHNFKSANSLLNKIGLEDFFSDQNEFADFLSYLNSKNFWKKEEHNKREWGDVQTPISLVNRVYKLLQQKKFKPTIIVEPTFGDGNFILSALDFFKELDLVYGIEISRKRKWNFCISFLLKIEEKAFENKKLRLKLYSEDFFDHNFKLESDFLESNKILIVGNPPWITISELSTLESDNLPVRTNLKNFTGMDALTGKSNFDISESIIVQLIENFTSFNGKIALLCKNSVINNILKDLRRTKYKIGNIQSYQINTVKEFDKKCDASLLVLDLNSTENYAICESRNLANPNRIKNKFGWINDYFVSDVDKYLITNFLEGKSSFNWRQGVKHDCSKILEFIEQNDGILVNKKGNRVDIEQNLVYPLMKSSDLREFEKTTTSRKILLPQKSLKDDTSLIKEKFPKTWNYLEAHKEFFKKRKSSVYKKKDPYSIFGIGSYVFSKYKVAISGMYKKPKFVIVKEVENKPVIFDDTCYFIGFNSYQNAVFVASLLNSQICLEFLESITFVDAKRPYTKENLMRINIREISDHITFNNIQKIWNQNCFENEGKFIEKDYQRFKRKINKK